MMPTYLLIRSGKIGHKLTHYLVFVATVKRKIGAMVKLPQSKDLKILTRELPDTLSWCHRSVIPWASDRRFSAQSALPKLLGQPWSSDRQSPEFPRARTSNFFPLRSALGETIFQIPLGQSV